MAFTLRMKVYERPVSGWPGPFVVSIGFLNPKTEQMRVFVMSDAHTEMIELTADEYDALPYHCFTDTGPVPNPGRRMTLPV